MAPIRAIRRRLPSVGSIPPVASSAPPSKLAFKPIVARQQPSYGAGKATVGTCALRFPPKPKPFPVQVARAVVVATPGRVQVLPVPPRRTRHPVPIIAQASPRPVVASAKVLPIPPRRTRAFHPIIARVALVPTPGHAAVGRLPAITASAPVTRLVRPPIVARIAEAPRPGRSLLTTVPNKTPKRSPLHAIVAQGQSPRHAGKATIQPLPPRRTRLPQPVIAHSVPVIARGWAKVIPPTLAKPRRPFAPIVVKASQPSVGRAIVLPVRRATPAITTKRPFSPIIVARSRTLDGHTDVGTIVPKAVAGPVMLGGIRSSSRIVRDRLKPFNPPRLHNRRGAPVAWWLADRMVAILPDITDSRRNGTTTLSGGVGVSVAPGPLGPRFAFSGTNGALVQLPPAAFTAAVRSFSCRFRLDHAPTGIQSLDVLYVFNGGSDLWAVTCTSGPKVNLLGPSFATVASATVAVGTEYHLVITTDGTTARLYLNGVLAASAASTATLAGPATSAILGNFTNGLEPFQGAIDDVRLYDRVLTPGEVSGDGGDPWSRLRPRRLEAFPPSAPPTRPAFRPIVARIAPAVPVGYATFVRILPQRVIPTSRPIPTAKVISRPYQFGPGSSRIAPLPPRRVRLPKVVFGRPTPTIPVGFARVLPLPPTRPRRALPPVIAHSVQPPAPGRARVQAMPKWVPKRLLFTAKVASVLQKPYPGQAIIVPHLRPKRVVVRPPIIVQGIRPAFSSTTRALLIRLPGRAPLFGIVYGIFRGDHAGGPVDYSSPIAVVEGLSYTDVALPVSSTTRFGVRAKDLSSGLWELNTDAQIAIVIGAAGDDETLSPLAPAGLKATATKGGTALVEWSYPFTSVATRLPTGFHVYLTAGVSPSYGSVAATVGYGQTRGTSYRASLSGLANGTTYAVAVRAFNSFGEEPNSAFVLVQGSTGYPANPVNLTATPVAG